MDLRTYLQKHRDHRKLNDILLQVVTGLKELHDLGFVHRDLKPENIVLNSCRPIKVALIDFDRSLPITAACHTEERGTPGYEPEYYRWQDGNVLWDLWPLVAIVVECDMKIDEYKGVKTTKAGEAAIAKHLGQKGVCKHLAQLANKMIVKYDGDQSFTLDDIGEIIKEIRFTKN